MGRDQENNRDFKAQSYFRLLKYAKPYWGKLTIGIISGLLVGGSLLVGMLMIPKLIGVVDPSVKKTVVQTGTGDSATAVNDPQLQKMLDQANDYARKFNLPLSVNGRVVEISWPKKFSFEAVNAEGMLAWQIFSLYVACFVIAWALKNLGTYLNHYYTRWVGARVVADLREEIFRKLINQSMRFYGNMDVGHLISRCTNDTSVIESAVSNSIGDLTSAPIQVFACVAAVLIACRDFDNYSLVVVLACGLPVLILPIVILGRKIRKIYKKSLARIADVFSRMHEVFSGIRVVKAYHTEQYEENRFVDINSQYFKQIVRALRLQLLLSPLMEVIAVAATLVFLVISYSRGISVTQLAALLTPAVMAYQPIKEISKVIASLQRSMAAADRYFQLIDVDTTLPEIEHPIDLRYFKDRIELRDTVFAYEDHKILDHVSFSIRKGQMVAVVGETGSGKTTLANLIARFYDVSSGEVLIDGVNVKDYSIASLRRQIGVVTQDAILFNDTIANNIAYGSEASREEIIAAAKLANAHEFIVDGRHAGGYDSEVGEKGFNLSGGEKQRVSIARAILRNPPILILDEATSALDTVTEKLVQEALTRVMANRTVFAIAHRLSTIQHADLIIVLHQGHIMEAGTHQELLERNGIYRKLHDTQFCLDV